MVQHSPVALPDLTGRRIIFDRKATRSFTVHERTFLVFRESAVLCTFHKERYTMKRDQLKEEIGSRVDDVVNENRELTDDDVEALVNDLGDFIADIVEEDDQDQEEEQELPVEEA